MRRLGWLVLAAAGLLAPLAQSEEPVAAALRECRARLDPELDVGFERIAGRCPGLARVLERSAWAPWLPQGWRDPHNDLSAGSLAELATLLERERALQPRRAPPTRADLAPVLAELARADGERVGLLGRLRDWLRSVFEPQRAAPDEGWLARMLRRLGPSEALMRALGYAALALVVALAIFILLSELRAAGLLRAPRTAPTPSRHAVRGPEPRRTWREVEQAPLLERPALVLELVLEALVRAQRLPPAGSLTASELVGRADLPGRPERERFATLAQVTEQARFGSRQPPAPQLLAAVEAGRTLLEELGQRARP